MKLFFPLLIASGFLAPMAASAAGAIAVDNAATPVSYKYGAVAGDFSKDQAAAQALNECGKSGNICQVAVRFEACGAYAVSATNDGTGFGRTPAAASAMALNVCGSRSCRVVISKCGAGPQ
jgi:hypothetical protein